MKKYLKLNLLFLLLLFSTSNSYAEEPCEPGFSCSDEQTDGGSGGRGTPINDYLPILILTAVAIAGIYSYNQRKLIQK